MGIADDVVAILKIKIKPRQDSYSDQFSRILLLKVMFLAAFFTGMSWYDDALNCLMVDVTNKDFAKTSCWINGFYVYDHVGSHKEIGYYGVPNDVSLDGVLPKDENTLCSIEGRTGTNKNVDPSVCRPMKKRFFLQYQYITFFFLFLGALYYAPYTFFKLVNTDISSLKTVIKNNGNADQIVSNYFNRGINPSVKLNLRVFGIFACKILYIIVNVLAFLLTNQVLHGNYRSYGPNWSTWSKMNNTMAYDYMGRRPTPKPGNTLLPSFALCNVYESAMDIKHRIVNKHVMVCELSQHILFQYILILSWWAMVLGIAISVFGFLLLIVDYFLKYNGVKRHVETPSNLPLLIRECEYLAYIRRKNVPLYGQVIAKLRGQRKPERLLDGGDKREEFTSSL